MLSPNIHRVLIYKFCRNFLLHLATIALILQQLFVVTISTAAAADLPITPDGSTNTQVTKTASGIDQINTATPNAAGLSHNKMTDFNVNSSGQVMNNFSGQNPNEIAAGSGDSAVTSTQIGGLVTVNPNLVSSGAAKVILTEVTSGNVSQLLGYTEIAGTKADLIIANPNGVVCSGCGFINTARLVMVGGSANFDEAGNLGFNVSTKYDALSTNNLYVPLITIDGLGLDATRTTATDIIASSLKLLGTIYGAESNSVAIRTGEGRYDYNSQSFIADAALSPPASNTPLFALDVASLAKIQAGNIYLIATKEGVGVKMEGEVLASSTVNIDANGDVYYSKISAGDTVTAKSTQKITSSSQLNSANTVDNSEISAANVNIQATQFDNFGTVSANNLSIKNTATLNNYNQIEALNLELKNITNLNNSGTIFGQNSLSISAHNLTNSPSQSHGAEGNSEVTIYSLVDYELFLSGLLTNSGLISSANNLIVNANQLSNFSEISAQNNLTFSITNDATNSGKFIATKNLDITADSLTNNSEILSGGTSTFNLSELNNSENSLIHSDDILTLNIASLFTNLGSIEAQGDLTVTGNSSITNAYKILSNADIDITADSFTNNASAITSSALKSLALSVDDLQNDGELSAFTTLEVKSADEVTNNGEILANNKVTITANSLINGSLENDAAAIASLQNSVVLDVANQLENYGQLSSQSDLNIFTADLSNFGDILAGAKLKIAHDEDYSSAADYDQSFITNKIKNSGTIQSLQDSVIAAQSLTNSATIKSFGKSSFNIKEITNEKNGLIFSNLAAEITANSFFANSGNVIANSSLKIIAPQITNDKDAQIISKTALELDLTLGANSSLLVDNILRNSGKISSESTLDIKGSAAISNYSEISSAADLTIYAMSLINGDQNSNDLLDANISSNAALSLYLNNLTNREEIKSVATFTISAADEVNNSGVLRTDDKLISNSASFINSNLVKSQNDLQITADQIDNANTKNNSTETIIAINKGLVSQSGLLHLTANKVINTSGMIAGNKIKIDYLANAFVQLSSFALELSDVLVISEQTDFDNNGGTLYADNSITLDLNTDQFRNVGTISAKSLDVTANKVINLGKIQVSDFIKFNATALDSAVADSGKIINGSVDGDNSAVQLTAGTYINLTAKNNIENYGAMIAKDNITLTSSFGDINNYSSGKITNGGATLTINAVNGSFNNKNKTNSDGVTISSSLVTSNNNAIFTVRDLNNDGEISVAKSLTINATNNLNNNRGAYIWSGGNMILNVANALTNTSAEIYAINDLTIQKNIGGDKTASLTNTSGSIITYNGNILINAVNLVNNRAVDVVDKRPRFSNQAGWQDDWRQIDSWCFGTGCGNGVKDYFTTVTANSNSIAGNISAGGDRISGSGGNLTFNGSSFSNLLSNVDAQNNITINTISFTNSQETDLVGNMAYRVTGSGKLMNPMDSHGTNDAVGFNMGWVPDGYVTETIHTQYYRGQRGSGIKQLSNSTPMSGYFSQTFYSYIKAGKSLTIKQNSVDTTANFLSGTVTQNTVFARSDLNSKSTIINKIDTFALAQTGAVTVDLSSINSAIQGNNSSKSGKVVTGNNSNVAGSDADATDRGDIIFSGSYKINLDSAATTPLVESRSQFTDKSKFFGSEYYFNQLGLDGSAVLGEVERQLRLNNDYSNGTVRMLGDSFIESQLIANQLKVLTNDSLLLSKSELDAVSEVKRLLDNAVSEFTALGLNAEEVAQHGLTTAQANSLTKDIVTFELTNVNGFEVLAPKIYLSLGTRNRLLGSEAALASNATIFAKEDLTIDAPTATLLNTGSMVAGNNLTLNVGSLSSYSSTTADSGSRWMESIAQIKSGNDLKISTASNTGIQNTYLNSGGTTSLSSMGDISIATDSNLKLKTLSSSIVPVQNYTQNYAVSNSSLLRSSSLLFATASTTKDDAATSRSALMFNSGSDIEIISGGNINIANNYTNSGGSIFMTAANNINNSNFQITASENVVMDANNINNISTATIANKDTIGETKIEAGNIVSINASKDTNGEGGNITNIGATISGGNLVYLTADNNITNKALIEYNINGNTSYSSGLTSNQTASNFTNSTLNSTGLSTNDTTLQNSNADRIRSTLISQGNITSGGNLVLVAGNNINNIGSKITADGSTYLEATNGNINITTAQLRDRTVSRWGSRKKGGISIIDNTTNLSSEISSGGNLELASGTDINITGSKLTTTESAANIALTAANDVNITAAQDTKYSQTQSWKKGMTVSKSSTSGSSSITNVLSEVTAANGDISIISNADTNLIGAKLKSIDLDINAGNELNIYSVSDSSASWASSTKSRNLSNVAGGAVGVGLLSSFSSYTLGGALAAKYVVGDKNSTKASSNELNKTSNISSVVEASGDVTLASNQDLTISGSNIFGTTGSLISDQGSVNILAAQEVERIISSNSNTSRTSNSGSKGVKHTSSESSEIITNIASNLAFTDSLTLKTNGNSSNPAQASDVNIKGSNITVSAGDLTLSSAGNVTVENAVDSVLTESSGSKRNETTKSFSKSVDYVETAAASNLSADNIKISSSGDTTIQGSNIDTTGNLIIGSFTIAQEPDGSYQKDSNGNYVTTSGSTVDNLIIKNADLQEYHYAQSGKGYTGIASAGMRVLPYTMLTAQVVSDIVKKEMAIFFPDGFESLYMEYTPIGLGITTVDKISDKLGSTQISTTTESRTDKTTAYASNLNVGGSMMTNSINDTIVQGSNLNIGGDLLSNALGNFTIQAATNTEKTTEQTSYETAGKFHSDLNVSRVNYKAGVTKDFVESGTENNSTTLTQSNVNVGGGALINTSDQFNLIASNLITTGSTEIAANNNLNISDGKETQATSSYLDKLTLDTGIQVGNAYVDAAYAVVDAVKAQKAVKDAYDKLEKIEDLHDEGMASSKAVERAEYQVVLALVNAGLSAAAAMQAVYGAAASSGTAGFYGSAYAEITKLKSTTTSEYAQSIASNLQSGGDVSLTSGNGDINVAGSNVISTSGDLMLTAMLGNINITAGESTYSQEFKSRSQSLGGSVGTNGGSLNIGFSESESSLDQTTYTNSTLTAENGTLKLNSKSDTNIIGANLLASDIILNTQGNLTVKSRQNLLESDSYSIGLSLGISSSDGNSVSGGSAGFNTANGYQSRAWTDNITSVIGTNSVTINTGKNTDIVGAEIANISNNIDLGNLTLNTKTLTYSDLKNYDNSESNSMGINLSLGFKPNDPSAPQNSVSAQNTKGVVPGNLALSLSLNGSESSSNTKATIGQGTINTNSTIAFDSDGNTSSATTGTINDPLIISGLNRDITQTEQNKKSVITSDFDTSLTIDTRLLAAAYYGATGNSTAASNNLNSYSGDTIKGAKLFGYGLMIPTQSIYSYATKENFTAEDALYTTAKNYNILYNLAYNPNIKASDLAGEGNLISYNGEQLSQNSDAANAEGFYDRTKDTAAVNIDSNTTDSQLAGTLAHEGVHRDFNLSGQYYTASEEIAAHLVGDFTTNAWDSFQENNTTLRASLPASNINNNTYANGVVFGDLVNPLMANELLVDYKLKSGGEYGPRPIHPITGKSTNHWGMDGVTYNPNKSVYIAGDGVVTEIRNQTKKVINSEGKEVITGWGNTVLVEHKLENGEVYSTRYSHLKELPNLKVGGSVNEGQVIGVMGATGGATGPHLHLEMQKFNPQTKTWNYMNPMDKNVGKYEKLSDIPK